MEATSAASSASTTTLSTTSVALSAFGILSLILAVSVGSYFFIRTRRNIKATALLNSNGKVKLSNGAAKGVQIGGQKVESEEKSRSIGNKLPVKPKSILVNHRTKKKNGESSTIRNISEPTLQQPAQRSAAPAGGKNEGEIGEKMRQALAQMKGMTSSLPHSRNSVRPMSTYRFSQSQFSSSGPRNKRQSSWNPLSLTLPSDSSLNTSGPDPDTTSCDEFGPNQMQRLRGSRISGSGFAGGKDRGSLNKSKSNFMSPQLRDQSEKASPTIDHDFNFSSGSNGRRDSGMETRRVSRVAVPSMLLRSLGDLPSLPNPNSSAAANHSKPTSLSPETSFTPILDLGLDLHPSAAGNLEDELDFEIEKSMWLTSTLASKLDQDKVNSSSNSQNESNAGLGIGKGEKAVANLSRQGSFSSKIAETKEAQSAKANNSSRSLLSNSSLNVRRPSMAQESRARSGTVSTGRSTNLSGSAPSNESVYCSAASTSSSPINHKFGPGSLPPLPSSSLDLKRPSHVAVNFPESPTRKGGNSQAPLESNSGFRPLSLGLSLSSSSKSSLGAIFKNARVNPWGGDGVEEEEEPEEEDLEKKAGRQDQMNRGTKSLDYNRSIYGETSMVSHGNRSLEYSTGDESTSVSHTRGGFSFSQESHNRLGACYSSPPSSNGSLDQGGNTSANECPTNDDLEGVMDAKVEKASIIQVSTPNLSATPAMPVRRVSPALHSQGFTPILPAKKSLEEAVSIKAPVPRLGHPMVQNVQQAKLVSRSTTIPRPSSVRKSSFTEDGKVQLPPSPNLSAPTTAQVLQKAQSDPGFEASSPAPIQVQAAQSAPSFNPSPLSSSFISPYHHAVFPELSDEDKEMISRKSISGDVCPSPILAQIGLVTSPTMQDSAADNSHQPHLSPRPSFGESLRARFSRSKSSSPIPASGMLHGSVAGITEQQQSTLVTPKSSHSDLSVTPPASSKPLRSPKSPNRPHTSTSNSTSTPNHSALATPILPFNSSSASTENSPFDAPPTAQWRVSTDGREDADDSDFLPKVTVCGPAIRRGSGAGGIGLGLSDSSDSAADFSKIIQQARAISASAAARPERRSRTSTNSKATSTLTSTSARPTTNSPSNSPIMQQSRWALSSPIQPSSEQSGQGSNLEATSSSSTLTSRGKQVVDLPMLQRKPSKQERASWSPLELVQQRFSDVGVAIGGDESLGSSSDGGHESQPSHSLKAVHEKQTLSPRSAYELIRSPSSNRCEQTWFGSTAVQVQQTTFSTPKSLSARSSRQLWNSECVSPRSDGGADTISIASSHSCMTVGTENGLGLAAEGLENGNGAADRRARLLQSVQENAAKELKKGHREDAKAKRQVQEEDLLKGRQENDNKVSAPNFALPLKKPAHLFIDSSRNPSGSRSLEESRNKGLNINPLMSPLTPPLTPADPLLQNPHSQSHSSGRPSAEIPVPRPTKLRPLSLTAGTILGDSTNNATTHSFNANHTQNVTPPLTRSYPHSPSTRSISASLSSSSSSSLDASGSNGAPLTSPRRPLILSNQVEQRERAKQVRMSRGLADGTGGVLPTISPKSFDYSPNIGANSRRPSLNLLQEEV